MSRPAAPDAQGHFRCELGGPILGECGSKSQALVGLKGPMLRGSLTCETVVVPSGRFELPTPALGERCSIP